MVTNVFRDERHCDLLDLGYYPTPCNISQDLCLCVFHLCNKNNAEENSFITEINHFHKIPKLLHLFFNLSHHRTKIMKYETVLKN